MFLGCGTTPQDCDAGFAYRLGFRRKEPSETEFRGFRISGKGLGKLELARLNPQEQSSITLVESGNPYNPKAALNLAS